MQASKERFFEMEDEFMKFHNANLHIYDSFDEIAIREVKELSDMNLLFVRPIDANLIIALIKRSGVKTECPSGYRINKNHVKHYVFLFYERHPSLAGSFTTRGYHPERIDEILKNNSDNIEDVIEIQKNRISKTGMKAA